MENSIALYEAVAQVTGQMLLAAREQDWEKLSVLERDCAVYVEKLRLIAADAALSDEDRLRKVNSIKRILADDREIRNLVSPWMIKLNGMLGANSSESY
jgi:flagellar protein FliT